jgi:hypothetical protein
MNIKLMVSSLEAVLISSSLVFIFLDILVVESFLATQACEMFIK